jgi:hypothetical protein
VKPSHQPRGDPYGVTAPTSANRRVAGLDRQTIGPALLVLALAVFMNVVLPTINSTTSYQDQIDKGDVVQVADGITLVPATGWDLAAGALVGETRSSAGDTASTGLVRGGVSFDVQAAPFDGTPSQLLTRVKQIDQELEHLQGKVSATSGRYAVRTRQGAVGVAQDFVGTGKQGTIVAFVLRPRGQTTREGVEIVASGPRSSIARRRDAIVAMIRSLRTAR